MPLADQLCPKCTRRAKCYSTYCTRTTGEGTTKGKKNNASETGPIALEQVVKVSSISETKRTAVIVFYTPWWHFLDTAEACKKLLRSSTPGIAGKNTAMLRGVLHQYRWFYRPVFARGGWFLLLIAAYAEVISRLWKVSVVWEDEVLLPRHPFRELSERWSSILKTSTDGWRKTCFTQKVVDSEYCFSRNSAASTLRDRTLTHGWYLRHHVVSKSFAGFCFIPIDANTHLARCKGGISSFRRGPSAIPSFHVQESEGADIETHARCSSS